MIDILKEKILEQENLISMQQLDYEMLQQEITRLQADNDLTKDKVSIVVYVVTNGKCIKILIHVHYKVI